MEISIIVIPIILGIMEGLLFHYADFKKLGKTNLHPLFTVLRVILYLSIINWQYSILKIFIILLSAIFMFSFLHNSAYYVTRNKLDFRVYKNPLFAYSTSSNAKISMRFCLRLLSFITGILLFITGYLL